MFCELKGCWNKSCIGEHRVLRGKMSQIFLLNTSDPKLPPGVHVHVSVSVCACMRVCVLAGGKPQACAVWVTEAVSRHDWVCRDEWLHLGEQHDSLIKGWGGMRNPNGIIRRAFGARTRNDRTTEGRKERRIRLYGGEDYELRLSSEKRMKNVKRASHERNTTAAPDRTIKRDFLNTSTYIYTPEATPDPLLAAYFCRGNGHFFRLGSGRKLNKL